MTMTKLPIPYARQEILQSDIDSVVSVLRSDYLTQGPAVKEFEDAFARYVGSKHALAISNGTTALHLCAQTLGVKPGVKVITSPLTFVASANCVEYCGGEVKLVDIDPATFCIDPNLVEDALKKDSSIRGIIPVDFAGYPSAVEDLRYLASKYNLWITEDACHAPGATFSDSRNNLQKVGNSHYSDLTVFSFHPVKHIAAGEGGMITTNNTELFEKISLLRTHGITRDPQKLSRKGEGWYYEMQELGYNYRIPDILAALGTSQLQRNSDGIRRRNEIASKYNEKLQGLPVQLPAVVEGIQHAYHLYVIQVENRKALYDYLKEQGIYTQVHYLPVHQQPYYIQKYGTQSLPKADEYYRRCLSIPMYPSMTDDQQDFVIEKIKAFFKL